MAAILSQPQCVSFSITLKLTHYVYILASTQYLAGAKAADSQQIRMIYSTIILHSCFTGTGPKKEYWSTWVASTDIKCIDAEKKIPKGIYCKMESISTNIWRVTAKLKYYTLPKYEQTYRVSILFYTICAAHQYDIYSH